MNPPNYCPQPNDSLEQAIAFGSDAAGVREALSVLLLSTSILKQHAYTLTRQQKLELQAELQQAAAELAKELQPPATQTPRRCTILPQQDCQGTCNLCPRRPKGEKSQTLSRESLTPPLVR